MQTARTLPENIEHTSKIGIHYFGCKANFKYFCRNFRVFKFYHTTTQSNDHTDTNKSEKKLDRLDESHRYASHHLGTLIPHRTDILYLLVQRATVFHNLGLSFQERDKYGHILQEKPLLADYTLFNIMCH